MIRPKLDERTGEHIDNVFTGTRQTYYIPFTKKNVDEIIANSAHTDKFIKYTVSSDMKTLQMLRYFLQETSSPMICFCGHGTSCMNGRHWPVDDVAMRPRPDKAETKLEFKPS